MLNPDIPDPSPENVATSPRSSSTDLATKKGIKMIPEVVAITEAIFACGLPGYLGDSISVSGEV